MTDDQIRNNLEFYTRPVKMPGGWTFSHTETLKFIDLYYNSQFDSGRFDSSGRRKYFYNIVKPAVQVAVKFIDLDTKDLVLFTDQPGFEDKIAVMRRDFKDWLKRNKFNKTLNDIAEDYPKYGHVVIKKSTDGNWIVVPLSSLRLDPSVEKMEESHFVYEESVMGRRQIRQMKAWNQEAIDLLFEREDCPAFRIMDCYDTNDEGKAWKHTVRAGFTEDKSTDGGTTITTVPQSKDDSDNTLPIIELYCEDVDQLPYRELKWENVSGRWLGMGFVEDLFDNQIHRNEVINMEARALYLTSLRIFQTQDETVQRNIMTDVDNGDILHVKKEITPLANEERNLPAYNVTKQDIDSNSERRTFSFDIATGGDLPSGTPLGVARLSAGMVASYFERKRENFGIFIQSLILDDILPSFKKQNRKQHLVKFFGNEDEVKKMYKHALKARINKAIIGKLIDGGFAPTLDEVQALYQQEEANIKERGGLMIDVPDAFYDDVKTGVDVLITGEQIDSAAINQTLMTALQIMGSNPNVVNDKKTRKMFFKMLELSGVSADELGMMDEAVDAEPAMPPQMAAMMQGGASMPAAPTAPPSGTNAAAGAVTV